MEESEEYILIPYRRVEYLKKAKDELEKAMKVKIEVDGNRVILRGKGEDVYFGKEVIKAIGRGFDVQDALLLLSDEYYLVIINLRDYFNTKNRRRVVKGRIIGTKGKVKKEMERAFDAKIKIEGDYIAIIAPFDTMKYCQEAIEMLINGAKHSSVFNFIASAKKRIFFERLTSERMENY